MVNSKPRVSVIIIFYNAVNFFEEAIESVFAQTYQDWELLLVDDGSTDDSTCIALRYAEQHPEKVRYLAHEKHQNQGASASRNLGVHHAQGEYIALVDADDKWLPEKLERQVPILDSQPEAAMLYCSTRYWYSWTGNPADARCDYVWNQFGVKPNTLIRPPHLLALYLRDGGTVPCIGSLLLRREALERVGGFEDSFKNIYEDQAFYVKFCSRESAFVVNGCWDLYRQHPDSCCHVVEKAGRASAARLDYLNWVSQYLTAQGISDREVWQALYKALRPYSHPNLYCVINAGGKLVRRAKRKLGRFFRVQ